VEGHELFGAMQRDGGDGGRWRGHGEGGVVVLRLFTGGRRCQWLPREEVRRISWLWSLNRGF
jgi:hypothetical protein